MPWQLIYTSAPRLLTAGQTGFGTVARHRDIPPLVVSAVERASQFARLPGMNAERVVFCHRIVDSAGSRHHVLSRTASAGADYTGRTNHLAHHVILTAAEAAQLAAQEVSAADVALRFPWRSSWSGEARWLEDKETPALATLPVDRHEHLSVWTEATGNPLHANHLVTGAGVRGCFVIAPPKVEMSRLFAEALRAVPEQGWQFAFTTELDPGDAPGDFRWVGLSVESPLRAAAQGGRRLVLDLSRPDSLPIPEPLPAKPKASGGATAQGARTAPPRIAAPAGGAFAEPKVPLPPPLIAGKTGSSVPADSTVSDRRGTTRNRDDGGHGWRRVTLVLACVVILLAASQLVMDDLKKFRRTAPVATVTEHPFTPTAPPPAPVKPAPPPVAPSSTSSKPVVPTPSPAPAPAAVVPLRVASVAQLASLEVPELRVGQTHLLITSRSEERGPLSEARNSLWLSPADQSPTLKLDYAAHRAVWTGSPDALVTPPVQWKIMQENREIVRVFIGDGVNQQPLNAARLAATQDESGVVGGGFAGLTGRFRNQEFWLRPPDSVSVLFRECGYTAVVFIPLRDMKADTSDLLVWVMKEQAKAESVINAPPMTAQAPAPPAATAPPAQGGISTNPESVAKGPAKRSSETNSLGNRTAPSSSVAGNTGAQQEQQRELAKQRMAKLSALRASPFLQGSLAGTTCSFFAAPTGSTPDQAVWICDVVFSNP